MVESVAEKRARGRPRGFAPDVALDHAVQAFWADGFDGVDVESIARAIGVTKPSLYRQFGDKASLFLHSLRRYNATHGQKALLAFQAERDIARAVTNFLEITVRVGTMKDHPSGCLMACVAAAQAEHSPTIRAYYAEGLESLVRILAERFQQEQHAGRLSDRLPATARAQLLVDAVQGVAIRARVGVPRRALLQSVRSYIPALLA